MRHDYNPVLQLLILLSLAACSGLAGEPAVLVTLTPEPIEQADLTSGARIFADRCSTCHGPTGAGDGELALNGSIPAPGDFTQPGAAREQSLQQWLATIRNGRIESLMPPWRDSLDDDELRDVALYSYTLHYSPAMFARGRLVLEEACAAGCAALDALGDLHDPATLDSLSDQALRNALPPTLSDEDAWAAVAWLRLRGEGGQSQPERAAVREPVTGSIDGSISNGTAGASVPGGLRVTLLEFDSGQAPDMRETFSADDGSFHFADVVLAAGRSFNVLVEHAERRFPSARVSAGPDQSAINLPVTIYETGADPAAITMTALVQQISVVEDALQIVLVSRFHNSSDRVFSSAQEVAPGQFASLTLPLPAAAYDLTLPDESGRYLVDDAGTAVNDTLPVYPNAEHLLQLAWRRAWDGDSAQIELPLAQALSGEARLLLAPTLTLLEGEFSDIGPQQVGAAIFDGYGAQLQLEPGASLRYTLATKPLSLPPGVVSLEALAAGTALTVAAIALLLFWRGRRVSGERKLDDLARQIADLDAAHDRGAINHDLYRRRRAELQEQLTGEEGTGHARRR